MTKFDGATCKRAELGSLVHGATAAQRVAATRTLRGVDDEAVWPLEWRGSNAYAGACRLCESGEGVRFWLHDEFDKRIGYGAYVLLSHRGPASDREAEIEMAVYQCAIDALTEVGAKAPTSDPLQDAFHSCGGSVSYI